MRTIQASEAKTHLPQLLDDVERGATLIVTRHGRAIGRLVPEQSGRQAESDEAIREINEWRRHAPRMAVKEILSARNEGRK